MRGAADKPLVARGMSLRHLRPARFRRRRGAASVEALTLRVAELVAERQQLRDRDKQARVAAAARSALSLP